MDEKKFTRVEMPYSFVEKMDDYEEYALLSINEIIERLDGINCYVKIKTTGGKIIFRKAKGYNEIKKGEIGLASRTFREINKEGENLQIKSSNYLCYLLRNSDEAVKYSSWVALAGFILAVLSFLKDICPVLKDLCHMICSFFVQIT